jgi:phosphoribosylglycinamide formyltransferase-1
LISPSHTLETGAKLAVLVSGFGSNLQAILDAIHAGDLPAQVVAVVSNQPEAGGLIRAREAGVPAVVLTKSKGQERAEYDRQLASLVSTFTPDWIVLAGWMRILTDAFLQHFPKRVVNLHPALPGTFPGTHAIQRALMAYQQGWIMHTGVMVHLVPDEGVDTGPLVCQQVVPILPDDTLESLETRMHAVEHELLVSALKQLINNGEPLLNRENSG